MTIAKQELREIRFENGKSEYFGKLAQGTATYQETREFIVEEINKHAFGDNNIEHRLGASFEGTYLRITELSRKGEPLDKGLLYDFATVYKFSGIDRRDGNIGFINIWVSCQVNAKRNKWEKYKLVMQIDDLKTAESIFNALKHYTDLITVNTKRDSRF